MSRSCNATCKKTTPSVEIVTSEGVKVLVHDHPAPEPIWEAPRESREPAVLPPPGPRVVIVPMHQADEARDAYIAQLDGEWGEFIQRQLARRRDIAYESAKELRQDVLILVDEHHKEEEKAGRPGAPENMKAFLLAVIDNVARNHVRKKARRPQTEDSAVVDEQLDTTTDPERAAILREMLAAYRRELTPEEAEVLEAKALGLTFSMIAAARGCSVARVFRQHASALDKLEQVSKEGDLGVARGRPAEARHTDRGPAPGRGKPPTASRK